MFPPDTSCQPPASAQERVRPGRGGRGAGLSASAPASPGCWERKNPPSEVPVFTQNYSQTITVVPPSDQLQEPHYGAPGQSTAGAARALQVGQTARIQVREGGKGAVLDISDTVMMQDI